jgi:hypothetical protein
LQANGEKGVFVHRPPKEMYVFTPIRPFNHKSEELVRMDDDRKQKNSRRIARASGLTERCINMMLRFDSYNLMYTLIDLTFPRWDCAKAGYNLRHFVGWGGCVVQRSFRSELS